METDSRRIYRTTTDSGVYDLPRAPLTSGMQILFAPVLSGMEALTGGGSKNLDGISTTLLALPQVFWVLLGDTFLPWQLRARVEGEEESIDEDDADKTKVIPDDDDTLIWVRLSGGTSTAPVEPTSDILVTGGGDQVLTGGGDQVVSGS